MPAERSTGMEQFSQLCEAIAATSSRNEKIRLLADFLRGVPPSELPVAAVFAAGRALPAMAGSLKLGGRLIVEAARQVWGFSDGALRAAYHRHGDLGAALADLASLERAPQLFVEPLTLTRVADAFARMARSSGAGAARTREAMMKALLADARPLEVKYLVKLATGESRIGLKEALVIDALAQAFDRRSRDVRRALMSDGDIGAVARLAREGRLDTAGVRHGAPIGFMLASPLLHGGGYGELAAGDYFVEDKFDGIRVQAHVEGRDSVKLFSRRLNEVSESFPEIAAALGGSGRAFIVDGELLAWRDGRALPFGALQTRLQRKEVDASLLADIPLCLVLFDLLADVERSLVDESLRERRRRLAALPIFSDRIVLSEGEWLALPAGESAAKAATLEARFDIARLRGNEGVMIKAAESPYQPGRRGRLWFKLKRELATLDCVVVAVEYGHGKRNSVLSDYTFAVRDGDRLATIGKAYSGLTDAEIAERTAWFFSHTLGRNGRRLTVEPEVIVEVAFDSVQRSGLHDSGFALRFPRIVRLRLDKAPADASSLDEVRTLAAERRSPASRRLM